jgi:hypothetical protein
MSLNELGLAVFVIAIVVALVVAYVRGVRQERHARELRDVIDAETRRAVRRRPGNGEHVFPSLAVSDPKPPERKKVP